MKAATGLKKGDPTMKDVVTEARKDMNDFVAVSCHPDPQIPAPSTSPPIGT